MNSSAMPVRPALGLVVEGHCEYECFPSFVSRIMGYACHVPRLNAQGFGQIIKRLDEQLTDLCKANHPHSVLVLVDQLDCLCSGQFTCCAGLREYLDQEVVGWYEQQSSCRRVYPLPTRVTAVIQVPKLESWFIADTRGLFDGGFLADGIEQPANVDDTISDPYRWLKKRIKIKEDIKHPPTAKRIIASLDPEVMREHSRSFDKFYREVHKAYEQYGQMFTQCG